MSAAVATERRANRSGSNDQILDLADHHSILMQKPRTASATELMSDDLAPKTTTKTSSEVVRLGEPDALQKIRNTNGQSVLLQLIDDAKHCPTLRPENGKDAPLGRPPLEPFTAAASSRELIISDTFTASGGTLQGDNSDVCLNIPNGAVDDGLNVTVRGAISTDTEGAHALLGLSSEEFVVTPIVEYSVEPDIPFRKPVHIGVPHFLPAGFNEQYVRVYQFNRNEGGELVIKQLKRQELEIQPDSDGGNEAEKEWKKETTTFDKNGCAKRLKTENGSCSKRTKMKLEKRQIMKSKKRRKTKMLNFIQPKLQEQGKRKTWTTVPTALQKSALTAKDENETTGTFYFDVKAKRVQIVTYHFSGYVCTYHGAPNPAGNPSFRVEVFARDVERPDGGRRVNVIMMTWDNRLSIQDFREERSHEEMSGFRGIELVDSKSLDALPEETDVRQLSLCAKMEFQRPEDQRVWTHSVLQNGEQVFPAEAQKAEVKTFVPCTQACFRRAPWRVDWQLMSDSHTARRNGFECFVQLEYRDSDNNQLQPPKRCTVSVQNVKTVQEDPATMTETRLPPVFRQVNAGNDQGGDRDLRAPIPESGAQH